MKPSKVEVLPSVLVGALGGALISFASAGPFPFGASLGDAIEAMLF